jgi:hypothetical protein
MVRQIPLKAYADTYTYSLLLIPIVNYHTSWSSSFISVNNENSFINGNQRVSSYWHPRRFSEGPNRKYCSPGRIVTEILLKCSFCTECKTYTQLMLDTLFSE